MSTAQQQVTSVLTPGDAHGGVTPLVTGISLQTQSCAGSQPITTQNIEAILFWTSARPMLLSTPYLIRHAGGMLCGSIVQLLRRADTAACIESFAHTREANEIQLVHLEMHRSIAVSRFRDNQTVGSFSILDPQTHETDATGVIWSSFVRSEKLAVSADSAVSSDRPGRGLTIWLTGLSGSGKSTLARAVHQALVNYGYSAELLDADILRRQLNRDLGFTKEDRDENVRRIGYVAGLLNSKGSIAIVASISPYRAVRNEVRKKISSFIEVHVNASLAACEARDPVGLYKKVRAGEISHFTGIDDPYEAPLQPEILCHTETESVEVCTAQIVQTVIDSMKKENSERDH